MKKVLIKTAILTFIAVILLTVLTFSVLSIFSPGVMADFTDNLGMDKLSLSFSVRKYENTEDLSDLHTVLFKANDLENYALLAEYSEVMTKDSDFLSFCERQKAGYKDYVCTNYIIALLETNSAKTFTEASRLYDDLYGEYTATNPMHMLVSFTDQFDVQFSAKFSANATALNDLNSLRNS